jgi:tetratricopeptide (TPR) repeat protein
MRAAASLVCSIALLGVPLWGQTPGGGGGQGNGSGSARLNSSRSTPRSTFLTGQIFLEDGAAIPSLIPIIGGCRGPMQVLGYADMQGHFSVDARSSSSVDDATSGSSRGVICEVSARLEGYRSNTIDLTQRGSLDNPDIGTILLHRIGDQEGSTVSMTSLQAPKSAKRAFDKGMDLLRKDRLEEAGKQFEKAVAEYPRYADAWYRLGHVQMQKSDGAAARASFAKSIAADPKLVPPYVELASLNIAEGKWQEAAENSQRAIKLDPFGVPAVYFFDALASYSLHNWDQTEKSARQLQKLDTQHRFIKVNRILGALLVARNDYAGAAEQLRDYLKLAPDSPDAGEVRAQLTELERRLAAERNR